MSNETRVKDILQQLDLGNSVAEFDGALQKYFVETEPFWALTHDRADIVAGDKGTGKSAIFRVLQQRYASIPEMKGIEVVPAFNLSGNPIFQRLAQEHLLTEAQYASLWKAYIFSLVGNWALECFGSDATKSLTNLDAMLRATQLRSADDAPSTVFARLMNAIRNVFVKSAEVQFTFSDSGIPIIIPKIEFGKTDSMSPKVIPHEESLALLDQCLAELGLTVWVVLDRLDEAFQGFPSVETPALRALFRTYLDLLEFKQLRVKLFVRRDLFRKIVQGGFVNLTHVNARKVEIVWDEEDLLNLLCQRLRESGDFLKTLGLDKSDNEDIFSGIFPAQIDPGERRPTAWRWIMSRIRDGNDIKPPRNLIDLVIKAREAQIRREERSARMFSQGIQIIEADAINRGLERLSSDRVEDTLLAEAGDSAAVIERFRDGKSEYDAETLATKLGVPKDQVATAVKPLLEIGFLESVGDNFKVPLLYRDGLSISQGKALKA